MEMRNVMTAEVSSTVLFEETIRTERKKCCLCKSIFWLTGRSIRIPMGITDAKSVMVLRRAFFSFSVNSSPIRDLRSSSTAAAESVARSWVPCHTSCKQKKKFTEERQWPSDTEARSVALVFKEDTDTVVASLSLWRVVSIMFSFFEIWTNCTPFVLLIVWRGSSEILSCSIWTDTSKLVLVKQYTQDPTMWFTKKGSDWWSSTKLRS